MNDRNQSVSVCDACRSTKSNWSFPCKHAALTELRSTFETLREGFASSYVLRAGNHKTAPIIGEVYVGPMHSRYAALFRGSPKLLAAARMALEYLEADGYDATTTGAKMLREAIDEIEAEMV